MGELTLFLRSVGQDEPQRICRYTHSERSAILDRVLSGIKKGEHTFDFGGVGTAQLE